MTNRELLEVPEKALNALERQRRFSLRVERMPMPCPACQWPINVFDAMGMDIDDYDFGDILPDFRCPACNVELNQVFPTMALGGPPWNWQVKEAAPERTTLEPTELEPQGQLR